MDHHRRLRGALLVTLLAGIPGTGCWAADEAGTPPSSQSPPAEVEMGTVQLELSGNRNFCVQANEIEIKPGSVKPRQYRNAPLVTTFGYKYQISASRRSTSAILKLLESPTIRTTYMTKEHPGTKYPQPRLATPKDLKANGQPLQAPELVPHWIPENTCTLLKPEYSFPLAAGRYDVYLGFDLLANTGQWVPLQSDFLTDVLIEKGRVTRVWGKVDSTGGIRTVKLSAQPESSPASKP